MEKRIKLNHGSARVDWDCSQKTIDMLNEMCERAYEMDIKELLQPDVIGRSEQLVCPETKKVCERKDTYYCNRLCERI